MSSRDEFRKHFGGILSLRLVLLCAALSACNTIEYFEQDNGTTVTDVPDATPLDDTLTPTLSADAGCHDLSCRLATCKAGRTTSVTGTVYDPSGDVALYNVSVYVPNAPLAAMKDGIDLTKCEACSAPLSGNPIAITATDARGHFKLENVPYGNDVPLVIQTGKFRRENLAISSIKPCVENIIVDNARDLRLPRNQSEGHLPLIAVTTGGCEGLECVLATYGFDPAEFTAASGKGRFHLYTGFGGGAANGSTDAYSFWGSSDVFKYDMIINSCECDAYQRDTHGPAYQNMKTYLDHGGRLFTSDFQYNWFTDTQAPAAFKSTATWMTNQSAPQYAAPYFVDTSFPKGKALDTWLQHTFANDPPPIGQISITSPLFNVAEVANGTTRWIYASSNGQPMDATSLGYTTKYLSFNTPVLSELTAGANQCGRAVFADMHVSHNVHSSLFPSGCQSLTKDQQVATFEFLFFDIASCVQDDTAPPTQPPPN